MQHHPTTHCSQCAAHEQQIAQLMADLESADRDPVWGVLTRGGLERRMPKLGDETAAIVLDLDYLHEANDRYGHAGVDARMTVALRATDQHPVGRWQHGDELVIFAPQGDALGLALRLQSELAAQGLSATCAIVPGLGHAAVAKGQRRIEQAKRDGERGRIFVVTR